MKIAIFGLGYVGLTAAGCLAHQGHTIVGVDTNDSKVRKINEGLSPISEPGLPEMLAQARQNGSIYASTSLDDLSAIDAAIVCVGTPSASDGSHNMSFIAEVTRQIATALANTVRDRPLAVVYRSTMRPGSMERIVRPIFDNILKNSDDKFELIYNPEFLREATAINDFFNPPKIVIGTKDGEPSQIMNEMNKGLSSPTFNVRFREAEITKFVDNTFHAVKVAFANEIGRICTKLQIEVKPVHEIFISDTKLNISPYYLRPGGAFGGSCLPKDVRALQYISSDIGAETYLIDSLLRTNEAHKRYVFEYAVSGEAADKKVLMIGLAFKGGSDDLRESPNLDLARRLIEAGAKLSIFDDAVRPNELVGQNLGFVFSTLPEMHRLLVDREEAESAAYDLVIDTRGDRGGLSLQNPEVINVNRLR
jgi:GDP-mannose 6-dehydrogenase